MAATKYSSEIIEKLGRVFDAVQVLCKGATDQAASWTIAWNSLCTSGPLATAARRKGLRQRRAGSQGHDEEALAAGCSSHCLLAQETQA